VNVLIGIGSFLLAKKTGCRYIGGRKNWCLRRIKLKKQIVCFALILSAVFCQSVFAQEKPKPEDSKISPATLAETITPKIEQSLQLNNLLLLIDKKKADERAARAELEAAQSAIQLLNQRIEPLVKEIAEVNRIDLTKYDARLDPEKGLIFVLKKATPDKKQE
jgi:hypothetical protein